MAGDWMKIELELPDKPEVHAIAGMLNIDPDCVVGKLIRVWQWFDKHTVDGNAYGVTYSLPDRISGVIGFGEAMAFVGWLEHHDKTLVMPKFDRHTSASAKTRALTAKRVASHKTKSNANSNDVGNGAGVSDALPREEKRRDISIRKTKIVLLDDGTFEGLESHLPVWENAYPSLDVNAQIRKAGAWCKSNAKRAPKSDYPRFLNSWLSRANENVSNDDPFAGAI
jgi:hypothetical protein